MFRTRDNKYYAALTKKKTIFAAVRKRPTRNTSGAKAHRVVRSCFVHAQKTAGTERLSNSNPFSFKPLPPRVGLRAFLREKRARKNALGKIDVYPLHTHARARRKCTTTVPFVRKRYEIRSRGGCTRAPTHSGLPSFSPHWRLDHTQHRPCLFISSTVSATGHRLVHGLLRTSRKPTELCAKRLYV